ncbi:GNAT family N-acetyltransferase [Phenylobacterium sp.]|uniref:GNAT family N-acetyltransferase n=1 Tax=Phenylobacterium sp. TaxID=1871053 RepID=UPI002F41E3EA
MQAQHALDRAIWNALNSRQAGLAEGDGRALRYAPDYGLFAAIADNSPESLASLSALLPTRGEVALVELQDPPPVPGSMVVSRAPVCQMVAERLTSAEPPPFEIVPLTEADQPQMFALARLTQPGPFFARTHQLGEFVGVKEQGRLVAMAGERMQPTGYTEVSGVCTDPEHRGRGYAGALMRVVAARILARNETPFLHAYASNIGAIGLYESLGFTRRREFAMTALRRA